MRRILEHSHLDALECVLAGELTGAKRAEIGTAQADDDGLRVTIEADAWPDFVATLTDRQPLVAADAQCAAMIEHGIDDRLGDLLTVSILRIVQNRIDVIPGSGSGQRS